MTDEAEALRVAAVVDLAQRAHDFSGEPVELLVRHETLDGVPHIRIVTDPASILLPVSAARIVFGALLPPAPVPAGAGTNVFYVIERDVETLRNIGGSRSVNAWPHAAAYCMWKFGIPPRGDEWRDTEWTPDIHKALKWTERADAEKFLREHEANDPCLKVAEHAYVSMPAPPSGGMTEGARAENARDLGIVATSYDTESKRVLRVHFNHEINDRTSERLRAALNHNVYNAASPAPASGTDEVERVIRAHTDEFARWGWRRNKAHSERQYEVYREIDPTIAGSVEVIARFREEQEAIRLVAATRSAAAVEKARAALAALREDGTKTETGWLIERQDRGAPEWYRLVNSAAPNNFWTKNAAEALRFARRTDAEAYCADSGLDDPGFTVHITEHAWGP